MLRCLARACLVWTLAVTACRVRPQMASRAGDPGIAPLFSRYILEGRTEHALAQGSGGAVLFGGWDGKAFLRDTLEFTCDPRVPNEKGYYWRRFDPPEPRPSARAQAATAAFGGTTVLFGGRNEAGVLGDTWVWDGSRWTEQKPAHSPPARAGHAMAKLGGHVVVFGGKGEGGGLRRDLWEWNGSDWEERTTSSGPSARERASMAETGDGVLLFGGLSADPPGVVYGDTWLWNGTTWEERRLAPASTPEPRFGHALVGAGPIVVLFGGQGLSTAVGDATWAWNGLAWRAISPPLGPVRRGGTAGALCWDKALVVGGSAIPRTQGFLSDAWLWDGEDWKLRDRGLVPVLKMFRPGSSAATSGKDVASCMGSRFTVESWVWFPAFAGASHARHQVARIGGVVVLEVSDLDAYDARIACLVPTAPGRYEGPRVVLPQQLVQNGWHHLACTRDAGAPPALFVDGKRVPASQETLTSSEAWSRDLFVGYPAGPTEGKVYEQGELRLSSTVRYGIDFSPLPFGARYGPDDHTCGLWHFGDGWGSSTFLDETGRWTLRAANGAFVGVPTGD